MCGGEISLDTTPDTNLILHRLTNGQLKLGESRRGLAGAIGELASSTSVCIFLGSGHPVNRHLRFFSMKSLGYDDSAPINAAMLRSTPPSKRHDPLASDRPYAPPRPSGDGTGAVSPCKSKHGLSTDARQGDPSRPVSAGADLHGAWVRDW